MSWGDGKRQGNEEHSCLDASHPPRPVTLDQSTSLCSRTSSERRSSVVWPYSRPAAGKSGFQHPPAPSASCCLSVRYSSGRVRSLKATVSLCCLEASYPSGRALHLG